MRFSFLSFFSCLALLPSLAMAQSGDSQIFIPLGTNWDNKSAAKMESLKAQSLQQSNLLPIQNVNVSLTRPDYMTEPAQFALLMTLPTMETGCHTYSGIEYETNYIDPYYLDITLTSYRRDFKETQHPNFDCDTKNKTASALLPLNAEDLKKRGITQIRFTNGNARDLYNIIYQDNIIRLIPDSTLAFKAQNLTGPDKDYMEYRFRDPKLVALKVPMAAYDDNIKQQVIQLASRNALSPVMDVAATGHDHTYYFTAQNDAVMSGLESGYRELGTITVARPYDGANGRTALPVPLKVFLTKPAASL